MSEQLALIDENDAAYDRSRFLLDARTRRIGLAGVARARAALAAAHPHANDAGSLRRTSHQGSFGRVRAA
jgi:hypothetical protein